MPNLTYAPLPSGRDIFKAIFSLDGVVKDLAKPWLRDGKELFWFSRSAWSLYFVAKLYMQVMDKKKPIVWFPDYFCNSSIYPLRELGVSLMFYPISKDGNPDIIACGEMLSGGKPDLIIAAHYFGKPASLKELFHFSVKVKAWLIEDAVHVLYPVDGVGLYGDFVMYSPHKFLPIPDGGLLISQTTGPANIPKIILEKVNIQSIYSSIIDVDNRSNKMVFKWVFKRLLQKLGIRKLPLKSKFLDDKTVMDTNQFIHPKMSELSKRLLSYILSKIKEESHTRKNNKELWTSILSNQGIMNEVDFAELTESHTPYLAGYEFKSSQIAEKIFMSLQENRYPVSTWPDLPPEVLADQRKHQVAIKMRQTRFFLPVHSSLGFS